MRTGIVILCFNYTTLSHDTIDKRFGGFITREYVRKRGGAPNATLVHRNTVRACAKACQKATGKVRKKATCKGVQMPN